MTAEQPQALHAESESTQQYVHLHVHTEFSLLDGLSKIEKLVARAKALGMPSIAITDHGAMHGVINFYNACMKAELKPIIGMEGYLARSDMRTHDPSEKNPFHLLLLARNRTGYQNLLKIASAAQLEGFYQKPRVDKDFLAQHAEGLICTSGCLAAEIPRLVMDGKEDEARKLIGWYQDVFGPENFFLELQHHQIDELFEVNRWLYDNRGYANVPLLATNDVHYIMEGDFDAHDTLLCIQTNALKSEAKRMRMTDPSYHLRSQAEMWNLFSEVPEALMNTLLIAEMCEPLGLDKKEYHLPIFAVPEGYTAETYLRHLAERGLRWRYGNRADDPTVRGRFEYELTTIHNMGFDTYFLIVWDLCQFARHKDIWYNARGSAAGSVVAYCLAITSIDPLPNKLIFERFLNPGRVTMPDIDMDFPDDRRPEMIEYAMRKYGADKVAAIITFGTLKARAAIKDVARTLNLPLPEVNSLTSLIPNIPSRPVTLAECLFDEEKAVPQLQERYKEPHIKTLLDTAILVEGVSRNAGTHAAGVIIADKPLNEYIPLHRPIGDMRLQQMSQFDMNTVESVGLLKIDFLGLTTLTVLRTACELIERYHGIRFTPDNIPYKPDPNDPEQTRRVEKLFELIGNGETTGVFQLESGGMKRMLTNMKPKTFEHIIAAISLYRPGPMDLIDTFVKRMHGKEKIHYHHPKLEDILAETYGIIVYQEQIQQIAASLFGYSLGDADLMRRAVSKKKKKDLETHKEIFMKRGPDHGVSVEVAGKIFDEIEFFAAYGFNKCLTYNTEVVDAASGRLVRIGDAVHGKAELDSTLTLDVERGKLEVGTVGQGWANGVWPVYQLITDLGYTIEATANHPFLTPNGWQPLAVLANGARIAVPRHIRVFGSVELASAERGVLVADLRFEDANAALPDSVFELTESSLRALLASLWPDAFAGASSEVGRENRDKYAAPRLYLASERLARQIQHLLLRCGVLTRLTADAVSFCLHREADAEGESDVYWDQVISIEYIGEQPTFDLTIPNTHNFVANNLIVHNSHAADYGALTCQTAYLKAHYPEEYYTALLSVQRGNITDVSLFTADCRKYGIPVLPPDINASELGFLIEQMPDGKRGIRYGLGAVKNVGEKVVEQIIAAREVGGPFSSLVDLARRVDMRVIGMKALECLAKVGAFDSLTGDRDVAIQSMERMLNYSKNYHKMRDMGQLGLFGSDDEGFELAIVSDDKRTGSRERFGWEKELVGLYVSPHPLYSVLQYVERLPNYHIAQDLANTEEDLNGRPITIAGLVMAKRTMFTKKGEEMAVVTLEDVSGSMNCVLFPRVWRDNRDKLNDDAPVIFYGKGDASRGELQIVVERVSLEFTIAQGADEVYERNGRSTGGLGSGLSRMTPPQADYNDAEALDAREPDEDDGPPPLNMDELEPPDEDDGYFRQQTESEPGHVAVARAEELPIPAPRAATVRAEPRHNLPPCLITITFTRTEDVEKDRRRLARLRAKLNEYPGHDRFRILFVGVDGKRVMLEYPGETTHYEGELEGFLTQHFGPENIQIEHLS